MQDADALCRTFKELAAQTWRRIGQADVAGLRWSEETNTEAMLLTLAERHPTQVVIEAISKHREAYIGADWEWWLGQPGSWIGMRVQAKRIKLPREQFSDLYSQRARRQARPQIENLIARAFHDQVTPAYCFYVHSRRWPRLGYWPERHMAENEGTPLGCLVAHASAVAAKRSVTLENLATISSPWHLLVCPSAATDMSPADSVYELLCTSLGAVDILTRLSASEGNPEWPLFGPVASLPPHVKVLAHRALGTNGADDKGPLAEALHVRQLAGVALFSAAELDRTALD